MPSLEARGKVDQSICCDDLDKLVSTASGTEKDSQRNEFDVYDSSIKPVEVAIDTVQTKTKT